MVFVRLYAIPGWSALGKLVTHTGIRTTTARLASHKARGSGGCNVYSGSGKGGKGEAALREFLLTHVIHSRAASVREDA